MCVDVEGVFVFVFVFVFELEWVSFLEADSLISSLLGNYRFERERDLRERESMNLDGFTGLVE